MRTYENKDELKNEINKSLSCCVQITKRSSFHDYGKTMIFFISSNNRLATGVNI